VPFCLTDNSSDRTSKGNQLIKNLLGLKDSVGEFLETIAGLTISELEDFAHAQIQDLKIPLNVHSHLYDIKLTI